MRIVRDTLYLDPDDRGAVAAIGNFDGVHLGHQSVIDLTRSIAQDTGAPLGILTFEPHPREFFGRSDTPFRLMNAAARAQRLDKLGVERLYEVPFNQALAALSAEEFATTIISERLGLRHVVVGADFCFGRNRAGDNLALRLQALNLGADQGGPQVVEIQNARDEDRKADKIQHHDAAGEAREAVPERPVLS